MAIISIHKALASLDGGFSAAGYLHLTFQSTRLSRASTMLAFKFFVFQQFQSTRLSRASTYDIPYPYCCLDISIHKALASLDDTGQEITLEREISIHKALASLDQVHRPASTPLSYFNPQGSREPRPPPCNTEMQHEIFQSTRLSRASTPFLPLLINASLFQSTRLSRASTSANGQAN